MIDVQIYFREREGGERCTLAVNNGRSLAWHVDNSSDWSICEKIIDTNAVRFFRGELDGVDEDDLFALSLHSLSVSFVLSIRI